MLGREDYRRNSIGAGVTSDDENSSMFAKTRRKRHTRTLFLQQRVDILRPLPQRLLSIGAKKRLAPEIPTCGIAISPYEVFLNRRRHYDRSGNPARVLLNRFHR